MKITGFLRDWALVISMLAGVIGYFVYVNIPFLTPTYGVAHQAVGVAQPLLIFLMLFMTFCKVDPSRLRPCKWHLWLLLIQGGLFLLFSGIALLLPPGGWRIITEGAMICFICPTATAAAVVTRKLGGDINHVTTYTILINLLASILIPVMLPVVHPQPGLSFTNASILILGKVFPLLLLPLISALLLRWLWPKAHRQILKWQDAPFWLWVVALALALAVTTRSLVHSEISPETLIGLILVSLISCGAQFGIGRSVGIKFHDKVAATQSIGQKNTVMAIWLGYTFFTPVTSVVGGLYSIWHNLVNSYQLYLQRKKETK